MVMRDEDDQEYEYEEHANGMISGGGRLNDEDADDEMMEEGDVEYEYVDIDNLPNDQQ
jgi:hypothetical protein